MQYRCQQCKKPYIRNYPGRRRVSYEEPSRPPEREATPEVIHRHCGGYLAVSPRGCALKIGVTAETEKAAMELFATRYSLIIESLAETQKPRD